MKLVRHCLVVALLLLFATVACKSRDAGTGEDSASTSTTGSHAPSESDSDTKREDSAEPAHGDDHAGLDDAADDHEHAHAIPRGEDGELPALALNDGEKWAMDAHTREMVGEMRQTVTSVTIASAEDGQRLGETLGEQLERLIRGCTMTGAAHENLHVFLASYMPAVAALKSSGSKEEAEQRLHTVKQMLETYDRYFE